MSISGVSSSGPTGQWVKAQKDKLTAAKAANPWVGLVDDLDPGLMKLVDVIVDPPPSPTDTPAEKFKKDADRVKAAYDLVVKTSDLMTKASSREAMIDGMAGAVLERTLVANPFYASLTANLTLPMPAATSGSFFIGMFHTHQHPPSWVPPAPPIPLLSVGPVITGCATVLIEGLPAATTGDIGYAFGCGSFSPFFKIFTGSSKVKIGGKRAARVGDLVKYCQPSPPAKPDDPPKPKNLRQAFMATAKDKALALVRPTPNKDDSKFVKWRNRLVTPATSALSGLSMYCAYQKTESDIVKAHNDAADAHRLADRDPGDASLAAAAEAADAAMESQSAAYSATKEAWEASAKSLAMDLLRESLDKLMGKDPGTPPPWGMIGGPIVRTVFIGGFPMPETSVIIGGLRGMHNANKAESAKITARENRRIRFEAAKEAIAAKKGRPANAEDAREAAKLMRENDRQEANQAKMDAAVKKAGKKSPSELSEAERAAALKEIEDSTPKAGMARRQAGRDAEVAEAKKFMAADQGTTPDKISDKDAADAVRVRKEHENPELKDFNERSRAYKERQAREAYHNKAMDDAFSQGKDNATKRASEAATKTKA